MCSFAAGVTAYGGINLLHNGILVFSGVRRVDALYATTLPHRATTTTNEGTR